MECRGYCFDSNFVIHAKANDLFGYPLRSVRVNREILDPIEQWPQQLGKRIRGPEKEGVMANQVGSAGIAVM